MSATLLMQLLAFFLNAWIIDCLGDWKVKDNWLSRDEEIKIQRKKEKD